MDRSFIREKYDIRPVRPEEAEQVAGMELICFPPNEACKPEIMKARVRTAPEIFLVAEDRTTGRLAGFFTGLATDQLKFSDDFFLDVSLHQPDGPNIMLLSLLVLPEHRGCGLAGAIVEAYVQRERQRGRKNLVLTCLEEKVPMYLHMGFEDLGISGSTWGAEVWHEMIYRC